MTGTLIRRVSRFVYLADADERVSAGANYGWRLVAANNRPLGRALAAQPSYAQCRDAAQRLHVGVADTESAVTFNSAQGNWSWRVSLGGDAVAVCVHPYLRRVECERALAQFLASVEAADPDEGVVKYFGPNSLRSYEQSRPAHGART